MTREEASKILHCEPEASPAQVKQQYQAHVKKCQTRLNALTVLQCESAAGLAEVRRQYQMRVNQLQFLIDQAVRPEQKQVYQESLKALDAAYEALSGDQEVMSEKDRPGIAPVSGDKRPLKERYLSQLQDIEAAYAVLRARQETVTVTLHSPTPDVVFSPSREFVATPGQEVTVIAAKVGHRTVQRTFTVGPRDMIIDLGALAPEAATAPSPLQWPWAIGAVVPIVLLVLGVWIAQEYKRIQTGQEPRQPQLTSRAQERVGAEWINSIDMKFVLIESEDFQMGSTDHNADNDEQPVHRVSITRPFYLGKYEVTQEQWKKVMGNNPSHFKDCGGDCPVEQVNWWEAVAYANALSTRENRGECYRLDECTGNPGEGMECKSVTFKGLSCQGYRLSMEAEWEYAARARSMMAYSFGNDPSELVSWIGTSGIVIVAMLEAGRTRWDKNSRIPGDCMTCMATSGNGCRIGMGAILAGQW